MLTDVPCFAAGLNVVMAPVLIWRYRVLIRVTAELRRRLLGSMDELTPSQRIHLGMVVDNFAARPWPGGQDMADRLRLETRCTDLDLAVALMAFLEFAAQLSNQFPDSTPEERYNGVCTALAGTIVELTELERAAL